MLDIKLFRANPEMVKENWQQEILILMLLIY